MKPITKPTNETEKTAHKREISSVLVSNHSSTRLNELRLQNNLTASYLPGTEVIGSGYFLYGDYARPQSIIGQLFDWTNAPTKPINVKGKDYILPVPLDEISIGEYGYNNASGENISKFQESLTAKVKISGAYNLFSGSISNEYSSTSVKTAANEFCRIQNTIGVWGINLLNQPGLRDYLKDDVRNKIDGAQDDAAFELLFKDLGSHFLSGIIMGGRANLSSATNKQTVDKTFSNETIAKATYASLTGQLSAEASTKYEKSISSFESSSDIDVYAIGGQVDLAANIFSGDRKDFDAWIASVADFPDFVDFQSSNQFIGIWELCNDMDQKQSMKTYFETVWGPLETKEHQILPDYIDSITTVSGGSSNINPPEGYTKIPIDLNKGANGKYIYLCYHAEPYSNRNTNKDCITDIVRITGKNTLPPEGYVKLPQDLNEDAGGKYIYLCYKKEPYNNENALKGLTVVDGGNSSVSAPYDYKKVPGDLNEGSGGKYVYACISKTS